MIELSAPDVVATIDPVAGGRVASFRLRGHDLVLRRERSSGESLQWGSYPMAPYAGRVRRGVFSFAGREYTLPVTHGPHAIHGTTYYRPWSLERDGTLTIELGDEWPFGGHAVQRFALTPTSFTCTIEVHNDQRTMPASAGWHPWFERPVALDFRAGKMYVRDDDEIPTGETVAPPPGPYDDCFTDVAKPPRLTWQGGPTITITSSCDHWVVFTVPTHALCCEPQSDVNNSFTLKPRIVEPGHPLIATMTWSW
jgi:aldose 1-epimerase